MAGSSNVVVVVRSRKPSSCAWSWPVPMSRVTNQEPGVLELRGVTPEQVGEAARRQGFAIHELFTSGSEDGPGMIRRDT